MKALVLKMFGSARNLQYTDIKKPEIEDNEVLIKLHYSGIGQWDIFEREGGYDKLLNMKSSFPYILGSEGSGTIVSVGKKVEKFHVGDQVIGVNFLSKNGGFYAEYSAVPEISVYLKPNNLSEIEASSISGVGLTAYRGIVDVLKVKNNESVLIFGASGGVGLIATQIAKSLGCHVYAIASHQDGVDYLRKLGVEHVVDGRNSDLNSLLKKFNQECFDSAFFTAGGELADLLCSKVKNKGRIAYPMGISELSYENSNVELLGYYADIDENLIKRFERWIYVANPKINVEQVFELNDGINAHKRLEEHYVGKLCFKVQWLSIFW